MLGKRPENVQGNVQRNVRGMIRETSSECSGDVRVMSRRTFGECPGKRPGENVLHYGQPHDVCIRDIEDPESWRSSPSDQ